MSSTELIETEPTTEPVAVSSEKLKSCENCHLPLSGPFCSNCGQNTDSTLKYFWVVILHLLDDIFSFDSRASRTVFPLITKPAFLTNEYFSGRRVHYVPPLRLYLFISIVFFITLKFFVGSDSNSVITVNDKKEIVTQVKDHLTKLQAEKITVEKAPSETIKNDEKLIQINNDIIKFNTYLADINRDYNVVSNKKIIKLTRQLIELEFEKSVDELSTDDKEKLEDEFSRITKALKDIYNGKIADEVKIGNNADGSLSFDFLSEEHNSKLDGFTKTLSTKAEKAFNSDTGPLLEQVISKLPQLMFILLPLFAVLLKVMFIFSKRLYMEHLTVALHSHSFIFITILLSELLELLEEYFVASYSILADVAGILSGGLLLWIPIYLFLMQKRVYQQGKFLTLIKYGVIGTIYSIMIIFTGLIAIVWGLMGA
jgi:hypothetical protein